MKHRLKLTRWPRRKIISRWMKSDGSVVKVAYTGYAAHDNIKGHHVDGKPPLCLN